LSRIEEEEEGREFAGRSKAVSLSSSLSSVSSEDQFVLDEKEEAEVAALLERVLPLCCQPDSAAGEQGWRRPFSSGPSGSEGGTFVSVTGETLPFYHFDEEEEEEKDEDFVEENPEEEEEEEIDAP